MNAAQTPSVAKKRKKEINEQMVSHMGHFKLSGSPKRKNFLPRRCLQMPLRSEDPGEDVTSTRASTDSVSEDALQHLYAPGHGNVY